MASNFVRLSVSTFNVWGQEGKWAERIDKLNECVLSLSSDILILQEINEGILSSLDALLVHHARIIPSSLSDERGYTSESTFYYDTRMFTLKEFGLEKDCKMIGDYYKHRGLFWCRLQLKHNDTKHEVFVSTAHLPWVGCEEELRTGVNQRIACCHAIHSHLQRLISPSDIMAIFGGDLNDDYHPIRILCDESDFREVFQSMNLPAPITHPVRPSCSREERLPNRTIDWLLYRFSPGAQGRPLAAVAKGIRGGFPPPSDHLPITGIFELCL